ncbi:DUF2200 family protein [Rheinheimera sp.]|uniref:DUF2200 family protein n=1 Tax=Rheinheimera sp. TaxID=1869214 RepID=UPI00273406F6|nr:DUF2200 family protein [Rheinheimera sp.]MDP2714406.1 DUF2200 family protein [Rheinheimera sp.]
MTEQRIFSMAFAKAYPLYVQKAKRKNYTKSKVDQIFCKPKHHHIQDFKPPQNLAIATIKWMRFIV